MYCMSGIDLLNIPYYHLLKKNLIRISDLLFHQQTVENEKKEKIRMGQVTGRNILWWFENC